MPVTIIDFPKTPADRNMVIASQADYRRNRPVPGVEKDDLEVEAPPEAKILADIGKAQMKRLNEWRDASIPVLEQRVKKEMNMTGVGDVAEELFNAFINNKKEDWSDPGRIVKTFLPGSKIFNTVISDENFRISMMGLRNQVNSTLVDCFRTTQTVDYTMLREPITNPGGGPVKPPSHHLTWGGMHNLVVNNPLAYALGSIQGSTVRLKDFKVNADKQEYTATLTVELFDHFGSDNSDLKDEGMHGTEGQICLWILQHERHRESGSPKLNNWPRQPDPDGHYPYVVRLAFEVTFSDPFNELGHGLSRPSMEIKALLK